MVLDRDAVRALLLDEAARAGLLPCLGTVLRSKPTSKALRFALARAGEPLATILFSTDPLPDGRLRLGVTHDGVASPDAAEEWKLFWAEWLTALEDGLPAAGSA